MTAASSSSHTNRVGDRENPANKKDIVARAPRSDADDAGRHRVVVMEDAPRAGNAEPAEEDLVLGAKPGETPPGGRPPISGGVLNSKAIYLPLPEVPPGDVVGTVMVQVLVDEQGTVVSARAISGPAQLHQAAVNAARFARFSPTMLMGEPVKVSGTLTYNFVKPVY